MMFWMGSSIFNSPTPKIPAHPPAGNSCQLLRQTEARFFDVIPGNTCIVLSRRNQYSSLFN